MGITVLEFDMGGGEGVNLRFYGRKLRFMATRSDQKTDNLPPQMSILKTVIP